MLGTTALLCLWYYSDCYSDYSSEASFSSRKWNKAMTCKSHCPPQVCTCAPSATTRCSPVAPSSLTHLLGRLSLKPSETTASPRWWRLSPPTRYNWSSYSQWATLCFYCCCVFHTDQKGCWCDFVWCAQVLCGKCGNGLGHEFVNDGPEEGVSRFWIFSNSLKFVPTKGKMTTEAQAGQNHKNIIYYAPKQ